MVVAERRRPVRLRPGATVAVVAPSGPVIDEDRVRRGTAVLEGLGFGVRFGSHARDADGYLAGTDGHRAADLVAALEDPQVDAVVALRGGYGALRTVQAIDPTRLAALATAPPKPVVGFSDTTVLHAVLGRTPGWVTFHGPVLTSLGAAAPASAPWTTASALRDALCEPAPLTVAATPVVPGRAGGVLLGGCLSLVASLLGTPWQLDLDGAVLLLEDVDEAPYAVDRLLTSLLAAGALDGVAAVVLGTFTACHARGPNPSPPVDEVLHERLATLGVPVLAGLPVGHGRDVLTLPLGVRATVDADAGHLEVAPGVD